MDHISDSQLNEYLDHALPADMLPMIAGHLGSCADCRARLDELQLVFMSLAGLPEARLAYDLSAGILARLPQKQSHLWTRAFAAQAGAALGILLWLSSKAVGLIDLTWLSNFRLPKFTYLFPTPDLNSLTINFLFTIPKIQFLAANPLENPAFHFTLAPMPAWLNQLPGWQILISHSPMAGIIIPALLLCVLVNAVLLRGPSKASK